MIRCLDCHQTCKDLLKNDPKSLLYFCDLDLIFKDVTDVIFHLEMRYFFNQLTDTHQTCIDT